MEAKLHLVKGNPKGKQVEVPEGVLSIGRAEESALIIASTRVSRNHCEIVNDGRTLLLRDKGSANGSFVNGRRVGEQPLKPGDRLQVGPLTFLVEINGRRESPPEPAAKPAPGKPTPPAPSKPAPAVPAKATPPKPLGAKAPPAKPAAPPKPGPRPAAQPKSAPAAPGPRRGTGDILASLQRMADKKPTEPSKPSKGGDVLEISDEDLLDDK
jgi:pyruvate/2-oxoglutarate dehydrogenase complex dihydrolipoamide acyltransferase (E2) component